MNALLDEGEPCREINDDSELKKLPRLKRGDAQVYPAPRSPVLHANPRNEDQD